MSHQYEDLPQYGDDETDHDALEEYRSNVVPMMPPGAPELTPEQIAELDAMPDGRSRVSFSQPTPAHKRPDYGANASELRAGVEANRRVSPEVTEKNSGKIEGNIKRKSDIKAASQTDFLDLHTAEDDLVLVGGETVCSLSNPRRFMPLAKARNHFAGSMVMMTRRGDVSGKEREHPVIDIWLESLNRKSADGMTFAPGDGEFCKNPNGLNCFNTWRPLDHDFSMATNCDDFLAHTRTLWGDEKAEEVLDTLAHVYQKPNIPLQYALLHIDEKEGTGRGTWVNFLKGVWDAYLGVVSLRDLMANHNTERGGKSIIVVEEINLTGGNKSQSRDIIKDMITAPVVAINPKNAQIYHEFNRTLFCFMSNEPTAIPMGASARRFLAHIADNDPITGTKWATHLNELARDAGCIAAIAKMLAERDLSNFNPGVVVSDSADKNRIIAATTDTKTALVNAIMKSGVSSITTSRIRELAAEYGCGYPQKELKALVEQGKLISKQCRINPHKKDRFFFRPDCEYLTNKASLSKVHERDEMIDI